MVHIMATNINEIIEDFMDEGCGRKEAVLKAKIVLAERKVNQKKSEKVYAVFETDRSRNYHRAD